jgi:hypothetical protein
VYVGQRRFAEAEPYFTDGIAYCDEHDAGSFAVHMRGERAAALERTGRWDEAVTLSTELLASADVYPSYRLRPLHVLGIIRARRGQPGAWQYLDEAAAVADGSGEPQSIIPARLARAEAHWLQGDLHRATQEAERADDAEAGSDGWERGEIGAVDHHHQQRRVHRRHRSQPQPGLLRRPGTGSPASGCGLPAKKTKR